MKYSKLLEKLKYPKKELAEKKEAFPFFKNLPVVVTEKLLTYLPYTDVENFGDTCGYFRELVEKNREYLQEQTYDIVVKEDLSFVESLNVSCLTKNRHTNKMEEVRLEGFKRKRNNQFNETKSFLQTIIYRIEKDKMKIDKFTYDAYDIKDEDLESIQKIAKRVHIHVWSYEVDNYCGIDNLEVLKIVHIIGTARLTGILENNLSLKFLRVFIRLKNMARVTEYFKGVNLAERTFVVEFPEKITDEVRAHIRSCFAPNDACWRKHPFFKLLGRFIPHFRKPRFV